MIAELQEALHESEVRMTQASEELEQQLAAEKEKARRSWKINCEHLAEQDTLITTREEEIAALKRRIAELEAGASREREGSKTLSSGVVLAGHPNSHYSSEIVESARPVSRGVEESLLHPHSVPPRTHVPPLRTGVSPRGDAHTASHCLDTSHSKADGALAHLDTSRTEGSTSSAVMLDRQRRGKAPPIEFFSGEDPAITVDDWLLNLERAATWNRWSTTEKLMQLPGYLKGRALQEWRLLSQTEQEDYTIAIQALRGRLDPGSKTMAAQDFRHSRQKSSESVADFIRRLEKTYQIAYGKDDLNASTRHALLYGQLYEGLCYDLMQSPAVSGAQSYQELCTAAKGEERRVAALKQRRQFTKTNGATPSSPRTSQPSDAKPPPWGKPASKGQRVCFKCGNPGHFAMNCPQAKQESKNQESTGKTKQVQSNTQSRKQKTTTQAQGPSDFLYSFRGGHTSECQDCANHRQREHSPVCTGASTGCSWLWPH